MLVTGEQRLIHDLVAGAEDRSVCEIRNACYHQSDGYHKYNGLPGGECPAPAHQRENTATHQAAAETGNNAHREHAQKNDGLQSLDIRVTEVEIRAEKILSRQAGDDHGGK